MANHYIRAGATGANNGSSWNDAWSSFASVSWVRGDTYYLAGGDYTGTISVGSSLSGTSVITIKKANASDNGGDAGWDPAYATTVATITGELFLLYGYIVLDGVTGSGRTGHGIHIHRTSTSAGQVVYLDSDGSHFSLKHLNVEGPGSFSSAFAVVGVSHNALPFGKGNYVGYCWVHECTTAGLFLLGAIGTSYVDYGFLLEYTVISETGGCTDPDNHGQGLCMGGASEAYCTVRGCVFSNIIGSAMIALLVGADNVSYNEIRIYNNVFTQADPTTYNAISPGPIWCEGIKSHTGCTVQNVTVANNVFFNLSGASNKAQILFEISTSNIVHKNNVYESCNFTSGTLGLTVDSNNGYFGNTGAGVPSGTTNQVNGSSSTFVGALSGNFNLVAGSYAVGAGLDLSSVFTADASQVTRSSPWDLGAFAYFAATLAGQPGTRVLLMAA